MGYLSLRIPRSAAKVDRPLRRATLITYAPLGAHYLPITPTLHHSSIPSLLNSITPVLLTPLLPALPLRSQLGFNLA